MIWINVRINPVSEKIVIGSSAQNRQIRQKYIPFAIALVAIAAAFTLTTASWLRLCSQACAEGHSYRIFGFTFEAMGLTLLPILTFTHLLGLRYRIFQTLTGWMLYSAMGAELIFIYIQKFKIGSWCPICLSIAACLAIATMVYFHSYSETFKSSLENGERGNIMNSVYKGMAGILFFVTGFILAFVGVAKYNPLQAAENSVKDSIAFGNLSSPVEVYIFTDWRCSSCRKLEPYIEAMSPKMMQKARVTFVDDAIHPETLNYTPYNLSFMVHNKSNYFVLRNALGDLAENTKEPTQAQIAALAAKHGEEFKQLNYADIALGIKYYNQLVKKLDVAGTPTLVVVNRVTKKGKKLEGTSEITEANVMKAIETLSK